MTATATALPRPAWADTYDLVEAGVSWQKYTPQFPQQVGGPIDAFVSMNDHLDPKKGIVERSRPMIEFEGIEFTPTVAKAFAHALLELAEAVEAETAD